MQNDDELDLALVRGMRADMEQRTSSFAEITRVLPRLPLSAKELTFLIDTLCVWRDKGRQVILGMAELATDRMTVSRNDVEKACLNGVMGVTAIDLDIAVLIVKVDEGRGFFGRQKASYRTFLSSEAGRYIATSSHASLLGAITRFGTLYRI